MVGNVTALPKLDNLSLSFDLFYHGKSSIREVHVTLRVLVEATRPAHRIHKASFVAIVIGNAKGVGESMVEWRKCSA
jgi:hypothetical protein